eukprot:TRINITY_DN962_c0_g1_i2.p1 TRINITY_DN962_c0_g1~~TRINITY_DN962_c0_g1_i2.p1  ORF type:complete len:131 (-),score=8.22 TRINITY_DN962_c0_g1_i2:303-695(-)
MLKDFPATVKILYVEDSHTSRLITQKLAERVGVVCETARDGVECCQKIRETPNDYQLILMDIAMPVMDGFDAAQLIRSQGFGIPIIAVTGLDSDDTEQKCFRVGMNGLTKKPLTVQKLKDLIQVHTKTHH